MLVLSIDTRSGTHNSDSRAIPFQLWRGVEVKGQSPHSRFHEPGSNAFAN